MCVCVCPQLFYLTIVFDQTCTQCSGRQPKTFSRNDFSSPDIRYGYKYRKVLDTLRGSRGETVRPIQLNQTSIGTLDQIKQLWISSVFCAMNNKYWNQYFRSGIIHNFFPWKSFSTKIAHNIPDAIPRHSYKMTFPLQTSGTGTSTDKYWKLWKNSPPNPQSSP